MAVIQQNLLTVDWSTIPAPEDDAAAAHLKGRRVPSLALVATNGTHVNIGDLQGRTIVYVYPLTGRPDLALPDGWDHIPGARGCTPQSCSFRDHYRELLAAGAVRVFGLSTQDSDYQREAAERLHLPFALLSDVDLSFTSALALPTLTVAGMTLLRRMAMVVDGGSITKVFYPVFPPDRNAADVLAWLTANPA